MKFLSRCWSSDSETTADFGETSERSEGISGHTTLGRSWAHIDHTKGRARDHHFIFEMTTCWLGDWVRLETQFEDETKVSNHLSSKCHFGREPSLPLGTIYDNLKWVYRTIERLNDWTNEQPNKQTSERANEQTKRRTKKMTNTKMRWISTLMAGALYDVFVYRPNTNAAHGREAAQRMGCGLVVCSRTNYVWSSN